MNTLTNNRSQWWHFYWRKTVTYRLDDYEENGETQSLSELNLKENSGIKAPIYRLALSESRDIQLAINTGCVTIFIAESITDTARLRPAVSSLEACPTSAR